ncbi:MAG: CPBP family intramembrane glutamic endopeptidase [Eubacteriaceae bacterium]|jgi:membrane protease YdiL (CAAX protease family)
MLQEKKAVFPDNRQEEFITRRIIIYLGVTFTVSWLYEFLVVWPAANGTIAGLPAASVQMLVAAVMLVPALSVLLTRLVTKEGFKNSWFKPVGFKKNWPMWLLAWFGPAVFILLGTVLYFLIFPNQYDTSMSYVIQSYAAAGVTLDVEQARSIVTMQIIMAILIGPILNIVTCFGEEWGWRGYLLPKMSLKFKTVPMLLINGVIWGIWHAPLTAIGHNYGTGYPGFPWTGILAMCFFCIVLGTLFSWVTLKTGSCLPAAIAHGGVNSLSAAAIYFTTDGGNPFIGPTLTGIIGGLPMILIAAWLAWRMVRDSKTDLSMVRDIEGKARFPESSLAGRQE